MVALVGAGPSSAEIGAELHVVEGPVKAHVSAVPGRLGLRNRVQPAIRAYEVGLAEQD